MNDQIGHSSSLIFSMPAVQVHEVGLSSLIGPGVLINLKRNGERLDADSLITIDDILLWETQNDGGAQ